MHLADSSLGVAVWLLPQVTATKPQAVAKKRAFLQTTLDAEGFAND